MEIVPYQEELRPALPTVVGNVDYARMRDTLNRIDEILEQSGAEKEFVRSQVKAYGQRAGENGRTGNTVSPKELARVAEHASRALRCNIVRELFQEGCRPFCVRLADSPLL